jgi:GT2 family glycosyltransferase
LEIVVVDASSSWDRHTLDYQQVARQISLRQVQAAEGLTLQRNVGVRLSQGDVVLFLDDDVVLDENYIAAIIAAFELDPLVCIWGVVGEFSNDPYERGPRAWKNKLWRWLFLQGGQTHGGGYMLPSGLPMYCSHSDSVVPVEVSCGITAYRHIVFQEFLFDEHLHKCARGEDADFSYRVSRKHRIYHTPFARLAHYPSPNARLAPAEMAEMSAYNHYYLFKKNLPQTIFNQFCFWWSNVGVVLRQLIGGRWEETLGLFRGYRRVLTNVRR